MAKGIPPAWLDLVNKARPCSLLIKVIRVSLFSFSFCCCKFSLACWVDKAEENCERICTSNQEADLFCLAKQDAQCYAETLSHVQNADSNLLLGSRTEGGFFLFSFLFYLETPEPHFQSFLSPGWSFRAIDGRLVGHGGLWLNAVWWTSGSSPIGGHSCLVWAFTDLGNKTTTTWKEDQGAAYCGAVDTRPPVRALFFFSSLSLSSWSSFYDPGSYRQREIIKYQRASRGG